MTAEIADLRERGVRSVIVSMVDDASINRVKLIPVDRFASCLERGVSFSLTSAVMITADDALVAPPGYPLGLGDVRLFPDRDSLRPVDPARGVWWAAADQRTPEGDVFELCQRTALRHQVEAAVAHSIEFRVAFEVEFTLFRETDRGPVLAHSGPAYGLGPLLEHEDFILDLERGLADAELEVEQIHPEYGNGQFELALRPSGPIAAVDRYVATKLVIDRVAVRHGYRVSFAPVVGGGDGTAGNGCHIHLSAYKGELNLLAGLDPERGETGELFVAGVTRRLRETVALLASSVNSYDRLQPGHWSGAFACWGTENREAAVRYIPGPAGHDTSSANIEVKCPDATSNPYLAVAAIIALGLRGIADGERLPAEVTVDPATLSEEERRRSGIEQLPISLKDALGLLAHNHVIQSALGEALVKTFIAIRTQEHTEYGGLSADERVARLRFRH